ncbi:DUF2235 domain-containing protein [Opitutus terrae]|uniref:T6SS Phospholipase effector Tle1-like catalytic domain-containing protein n=1 Tax=Opitutus terrae (strain DSM 11246 / JCM 15787 / PB90-1) TaxID=452637 RepID=B1ZSI6_OPITP|nr:DUF2235 domain-containing protein [Opitutus terrae]ACB73843.1 conserved hypothetical protein [Opitutus terrae PB90-1]
MKNLIVTCDGTWNTADQKQDDIPAPTNVVRLYNALAKQDAASNEQRKYYHPGVGTEGSKLERLGGGAYGLGISRNIMSGYRWLADHYETGDQIFLFGFSRGAYTARSLGGFIGCCGLPDLAGLSPADAWKRVEQAYHTVYRVKPAERPPISWPVLSPGAGQTKIPLQFIGVWDTVGALGVPDDLALLNLLDDPTKWQFHDTTLGDHVRFARHAVAIDELRASFTPTFWTDDHDRPLNDGTRVRQLWFPGVHSDVGGGYAQCGLSDLALAWMIDEAATAGLAFLPSYRAQIKPDPRGLLHDSLGGAFKALHSRPRNRPRLTPDAPDYHPSAWDRDEAPPITQSPYHHPSVALQVGQSSEPIDVYARNHWNETGLFLEDGATYEFTAKGEWVDKSIPCGPAGTNDGKFHLGEVVQLAGTLLGKLESGFRKVSGNAEADLIGTRRAEEHPWFALLGAIANDGPQQGKNPSPDGSPYPHQTFLIGSGPTRLTLKPTEAGYLYAFANDAWHFYENNRGSVTLTVKRVA